MQVEADHLGSDDLEASESPTEFYILRNGKGYGRN